jgi:hypothetical protein
VPIFKLPEGGPEGPKVADLLDRLVAIRVGDMGEVTVRGDQEKFRVEGDTWILDLDAKTVEPLGTVAFFQEVLAEKLAKVGPGEWMLAWLRKPGKAYDFKRPSREEQRAAEALAERLPDAEPVAEVSDDYPVEGRIDDRDYPGDEEF